MNKIRRGFTLIEVSLFLAITGVVFVSIAVGTQNSIFQQRYNDSVQNFSEFLRTVYSQVKNVQNNESKGNTDKAIYGKLVTFGEEYNLNGDKNTDEMIFTYNVIGKIGNEDGNIIDQLKDLEANVVYETYDALGHTNGYELAGFAESYLPRWGSKIQTTAGWNGTSYDNFEGTLLIVRHPSSGVIYTKVLSHTIQVNDILKNNKVINVIYHDQIVGRLALTSDNLCAFEYDRRERAGFQSALWLLRVRLHGAGPHSGDVLFQQPSRSLPALRGNRRG